MAITSSLIVNNIEFYSAPTPKLLTRDIRTIVSDKLSIYKKKMINNRFSKNNYWQDYDDFVGELTGLKLYCLDKESKEKGAGGYYDIDNKLITCDFEDHSPISILCHEIGHHIQYEAGLLDLSSKNTLSDIVKMEQQCETIGLLLYSKLPFVKTERRPWDTYFTKHDINWLAEWCNGYYQNDLV